jgi:hypothetical protein
MTFAGIFPPLAMAWILKRWNFVAAILRRPIMALCFLRLLQRGHSPDVQ